MLPPRLSFCSRLCALTIDHEENLAERPLLVWAEVETLPLSLLLSPWEDFAGDLTQEERSHCPALRERVATQHVVADFEHRLILPDSAGEAKTCRATPSPVPACGTEPLFKPPRGNQGERARQREATNVKVVGGAGVVRSRGYCFVPGLGPFVAALGPATGMSGGSVTVRAVGPARTSAEVAQALEIDTSASCFAALDDARIGRVARHIADRAASETFQRATWDNRLFWNAEADVRQRSQYFAIGNAINFRFWRLRDGRVVPAAGLIEGERFRGAMYMWRCLRRCLDKGEVPLLDAAFLANLSESDFDEIFSDDGGAEPLAVAREERIANLRDLGIKLLERWDGLFYNLVLASQGSIVAFAQRSSSLRAFDDPLFKLTMVNAIVHSGSGVYTFADQPLPAIDYHLLRHALRQGLITPEPALAEKLRAGRLLESGEGFELRRVALQAFVQLAQLSGQSGEVIDNNYWLNRVNCTDEPVCLDQDRAQECPFLEVCEQETAYQLPLELTRYY